jgi:hypothetical protein
MALRFTLDVEVKGVDTMYTLIRNDHVDIQILSQAFTLVLMDALKERQMASNTTDITVHIQYDHDEGAVTGWSIEPEGLDIQLVAAAVDEVNDDLIAEAEEAQAARTAAEEGTDAPGDAGDATKEEE